MNRRTNVRGALICFNICTPNNPPSCGHDGAESCSWGFLDSSGFWPGADIGMKMYRDQHIATKEKKVIRLGGNTQASPPPQAVGPSIPGPRQGIWAQLLSPARSGGRGRTGASATAAQSALVACIPDCYFHSETIVSQNEVPRVQDLPANCWTAPTQ